MSTPTIYIKRFRVGDRLHVAVCEGNVVVGEVLVRLRQVGEGSAELMFEADRSTVYTDEKRMAENERSRPRGDSRGR